MFYYINQPCTPSFPIGLVKTESDFIVRSIETGLGKSMLVVVLITLWIQEYVSFGCSVLPDSKETELRSSDQDA